MERDARLFHVMINFLIELGTIRELDSRVDARYQDKRNKRYLYSINIVCIFKEIYIFDNDIFTFNDRYQRLSIYLSYYCNQILHIELIYAS